MDHVVYIKVPEGDTADRIARAAVSVSHSEFAFEILERDGPREQPLAELAFLIVGAATVEDAMARAVQIYSAARADAGLAVDTSPQASAAVWPASPG